RGKEPIARFHPAFVETNAQPSITRQLRIDHGATTAKEVATVTSTGAKAGLNSAHVFALGRASHKNAGAARRVCGRTRMVSPKTMPASTALLVRWASSPSEKSHAESTMPNAASGSVMRTAA